jgi:hypothetical protein
MSFCVYLLLGEGELSVDGVGRDLPAVLCCCALVVGLLGG